MNRIPGLESLARVAFIALLLLQPVWHGWLHPPVRLPTWVAVAIATLPLLLLVPAVLRRRPAALFWAGLLALAYFCHGVAEAWTSAPERVAAAMEIFLSLALVGLVGASGLQRRRAARIMAVSCATADQPAQTARPDRPRR